MSIKIEMLRCFLTVVEQGRLSDAAQVLGRTPSAVSMMLKQFEDNVGAPLFETARKARLTPLGEQVLAEARRELAHFDRTLSNIHGLARAELGRVRLAVTPSVAVTILPPIIRDFMARHPGVHIDMRDMNSAAVQQDLMQDRADIGLASLGPIAGLDRQHLFADPFGVVCRRDNPLARRWDDLTWADLPAQGFIANGLCDQIAAPEFQHILHSARLTVPNTASLLALVRAGVGITLLPKLAVPPEFEDIAFLPLADTGIRRQVWMLTPPRAMLTPAAQAFVTAIETAKPFDV